jgi:hypothetical protein
MRITVSVDESLQACPDGKFYLYKSAPSCYPPLRNITSGDVHKSGNTNFFSHFGDLQFLSSPFLYDYFLNHECRTVNGSDARAFIMVLYPMLWTFKSRCFLKAISSVHLGPYWKHNAPKHFIFHSFGGPPYGTNKFWQPATVVAKDNSWPDKKLLRTWVFRNGSKVSVNNKDDFSYGQKTSVDVVTREIPSICRANNNNNNNNDSSSSLAETQPYGQNCYAIASSYRRGMTMAYYEDMVPQEIKPPQKRRILLGAAFGSKNGALALRQDIKHTMQNISNAKWLRIDARRPSKDRLEVKVYKDSVFCVVPKGDSASRRGLSTCIIYGSIPIVCSDHFVLPYHNILDYSKFSFHIPEAACTSFLKTVENIKKDVIQSMYAELLKVRNAFIFIPAKKTNTSITNNTMKNVPIYVDRNTKSDTFNNPASTKSGSGNQVNGYAAAMHLQYLWANLPD